jgi:hypothetical protein
MTAHWIAAVTAIACWLWCARALWVLGGYPSGRSGDDT